MRTPITRRILSLLLLAAMLVSMLGSSFAFAAEVPVEETLPVTESEPAEEALPTDEADALAGAPSEDLPNEETSSEEIEAVSAEEESAAEETVIPAEELAEVPESYTYDGYEAPNLFADEVPDYFLDEDNWNVLDHSEPVLPVSDLSEEDQMAEANQELISASVMATSDGYDYEEELAKFPESYQPYLEELHELHPEWVFVAVDTGLTWEEAIEGELGAASTIDYNLNGTTHHLLLNNRNGYYSTSGYTSTNGYKPIDGRHVSCSRAALGYYMDPRNFLIEKYIFQFEDQAYSSVQQLEGVQKILKNADSTSKGLYHMKNYVTTSGTTATLASLGSDYGSDYSTIIYRSGMAAGVSPYYLASKIAQETGATTENASICGTYSGYTGIYNFYNIGAYASTTGQAVANGLKYAKEHGWTNPILAVKGGADFLASSYIAKGQNTGYYMRFNVGPEASHSTFTHQYMSATYAVASEATSTYSGYVAAEAEDSPFLFYIPVYDNMPDQDSTVSLTATTKGTTNDTAKLYSGPSTSDTLLATVPSGATVTVLGGSVTSSNVYISRLYYPYWYKVKVTVSGTSYTGYVREELVDLSANYTLKSGAKQTLANIRSTDGNVGTLYYETSDPAVATVSDSGIITAVGNGSCKIYAISTGGSFDAIGVKVSSSGSSGSSITADSLDIPNLVDIANTASGVKVTWNSVEDASGYTVWRKTPTTGWNKLTALSSGTTTSYTDTAALSGTEYTYTVRATNGSVVSWFDETGLTITYLSVPALGSISYSIGSGLTSTWSAVDGAEGYIIYRKASGSGWKELGRTSTDILKYSDQTMVSGTKYIYTVRAYSGTSLSNFDSTGLPYLYLSIPKLISATGDTGSITVKWESVTGASGYKIWRRTASTGWTMIGTIASGSTLTYIDSNNLTTGTTYTYTVRATCGSSLSWFDSTGVSASLTSELDPSLEYESYVVRQNIYYRTGAGTSYSVAGSFAAGTTVQVVKDWSITANSLTWYKVKVDGKLYYVAANYLLATPTLKSASNTINGVTVSWNKVSSATGYKIWRRTASTGWTYIGSTSSNSIITFKDSTAVSGTTYKYTVRATYGSYQSGFDSAGVSCLCLSVPTLSSASAASSGIKVSWKAVTGATGYTVWRKTSSTGWSKIATISSGSTLTYTDSYNLTAGTTYIYTVRATCGNSLSWFDTSGISAKFGTDSSITLVDYVTTGNLNYRTGPGTNYTLAGTVASGTTVKVVSGESYDVDGTPWYRVYINGNYYYMSSKYLKKA